MLTNWQQEWVIWAGHQTELTVCRTGRPLGTWGNCPNRREVISLVQECFRDAYTGMITCCRSRKMSVLTPDFFFVCIFFFLEVMHFTNSEDFPWEFEEQDHPKQRGRWVPVTSELLRMLLISEASCGLCGRKPVARSLVWKFLFLLTAQCPTCNVC